jgi:glutamate carboxypeptidase
VADSPGHVLLVTHYDTVWSVGELERQPFVVDGDRVTGPGVFDMKSGIVAIELALEELRASGRTPSCTVRIVCIADEEVSSLDGRSIIESAAQGAIAVLGFEPAHPDGSFKSGRRGVARLALRVTGRASHSGLAASDGVSAIDELVDLLLDVRRDAPVGHDAAINVGRISGGTRANVVAGAAEAEIGLRFAIPPAKRTCSITFMVWRPIDWAHQSGPGRRAKPSPGAGSGRCSRWGSARGSPGARARPPRRGRPARPR